MSDNKVMIGMCLRDDGGHFLRAKTYWFSPLTNMFLMVKLWACIWPFSGLESWASTTWSSKWMVVNAFNSHNNVISQFGCLISSCKSLFSLVSNNSHVEFAGRNVNRVAHSLVWKTLFLTSPQEYYDIVTCIFKLIMNEMY